MAGGTRSNMPAAAPPPSPCPHTRPHHCPHNCPHTWPGAFHKSSHFFTPGAPAVGAAAASCQVHEMGVGGLLLRLAWQRPASGWCYIGPDRRCLGRLACREIGRLPEGSSAPSGTAANVGSDGPAVPGKSRAGEEGGTPTGTAANVGSDGPAVPGKSRAGGGC